MANELNDNLELDCEQLSDVSGGASVFQGVSGAEENNGRRIVGQSTERAFFVMQTNTLPRQ